MQPAPPLLRSIRDAASRRAAARICAAVACTTVVAAGAAGPAGATPTGTGGAGAAAPSPALTTSLLSPRRLPDWLATSVAHARLRSSLTGALNPTVLGSAAASTCAVVTQGGTVLASTQPTTSLIPASNMKLLTVTAALDKLGPTFVYSTRVLADAGPVGGVVAGNLYLVGAGDPMLRTQPYVSALPYSEPDYTSLAQLAAQVAAAGVTEVTGSVVGDESLFDTQRDIPTWKPVYTSEGDVGPLSALDVNDGFTLGHGAYRAAAQPAESAASQFATLLAADGVKFPAAIVTPPPTTTTTPTTTTPTTTTPTTTLPPTVTLPAAAGTAPPSAVAVTSIDSPPLSVMVQTILRASDDTGAELLVKELGAKFGDAGTTAAGLAVIRADLAADGLPVAGMQAADGSGLDRSDHVTCQLIVDDLVREGPTSVLGAGLPVAGTSGTLGHRLTAPATVGRILAKTGTLDDVSALSGFVLPKPGVASPAPGLADPLVFSLIMDNLSSLTVGVTVGDDIATLLAGYPTVPAASTLGPR